MNQETVADVSYSIGFSLAILFLLIIISYISYKCNNRSSSSSSSSNSVVTNFSFSNGRSSLIYTITSINGDGDGVPKGLNESTLVNYPKFMYSQMKKTCLSSNTCGCSICLTDYGDDHMLRLLPDCGHLFHLRCIDIWLKLHPSCPICRTTPLPTPSATPLSQIACQS